MASDRSAPTGAEGALRALEGRLARASEAAERVIAEAARAAAGEPTPRQGWQAPPPDSGSGSASEGSSDLELLLGMVQRLRDLVPAELQRRVAEALRELLLAVRALIDWWVERLERNRREPAPVRDIPIL